MAFPAFDTVEECGQRDRRRAPEGGTRGPEPSLTNYLEAWLVPSLTLDHTSSSLKSPMSPL